MPISLERIDDRASQYIDEHRDPKKVYPGHEKSHLERVAKLTSLAGKLAGCSSRVLVLSRIAGWFHDFGKSMTETNRQNDESSSAGAAVEFADQLDHANLYHTTLPDREDICHAISECSRPPTFFTDRPSPDQWSYREQVQAILFVADKLEANGVMVIARRSQYVGGARLRDSQEADLPNFDLHPGQDEAKAVLLESAVRIIFINPENAYPPVFKPLTSEMYSPQRDFIHGLLASTGMSIDDYADLLLNTKLKPSIDPRQPNYLQTRRCPNLSRAELAKKLRLDGGLSDTAIRSASQYLVSSALEAITYFSSDYEKETDALIQAWQPQNQVAKVWQQQMVEYLNGNWYKSVESKLL